MVKEFVCEDMTGEELPAIVILTHGRFGEALLDSASMVFGAEAGRNTYSISLQPEDDPDKYMDRVESVLSKVSEDSLIMVDILGGTPFNTLMKLFRDRIPNALTGVNLPLLVEALNMRSSMSGQELLNAVCTAADSSIINITKLLLTKR